MNRLITHLIKYLRQHGKILMLVLIAGLFSLGQAQAATTINDLTLSNVPLDVQTGVPPNILLTLDNSGSMAWYFLPDTSRGDSNYYNASSAYNLIYYNPKIRYYPSVDASGQSMGNASFTAAWGDAYQSGTRCTVNLSTEYSVVSVNNTPSNPCPTGSTASEPAGDSGSAWYYNYTPANCSSPSLTNNACYTPVVISSSTSTYVGGPDRTDCANPMACTYAEESQNFANWFSYYRTRIMTAKTSISLAFKQLTSAVRVSQFTINKLNSSTPNTAANNGGNTPIPVFQPFTGTARTNFYSWLQGMAPQGGTPMREAFYTAGEDFSSSGSTSPYAYDPENGIDYGPGMSSEYSCRQNFNVVITDGFWNGSDPTTPTSDVDSSSATLPEPFSFGTNPTPVTSYPALLPYADGYTKTSSDAITLADIAHYFWATDLRPSLANDVPSYVPDSTTTYNFSNNPPTITTGQTATNADIFHNPLNDPATWQHMVNFTIGLAVPGDLAFDPNGTDNYSTPLVSNSLTAWPEVTTSGNENARADDLWHAAINSRGRFFVAKNPNSLITSLTDVLNSIGERNAATSAVATTSSTYIATTGVFQSVYDPSSWTGNLYAYNVTNTNGTPYWDAATKLQQNHPDGQGRVIITYDPATDAGIPFEWSDLDTSQQALLNGNSTDGNDVLDYIRGDQSKEQSNGGPYRNRKSLLGDMVDSAPVYVGPPDRAFPDSLEIQPYSQFKAANANRTPMVWIGANDGMLHCFDADLQTSNAGNELLAYIPSSVYPNLRSLSSPSYAHNFFVDGSPISRDAFFGGAWHTVLVGGLDGGGQGVYALDITDPTTFSSEASAAKDVLWEFTDANDPDMGYSYSQPQVAKMNSTTSQWAAIFGNGYNNTAPDGHVSSTGDAVLYILDIQTGKVIRKFDTGVGFAQDPTGQDRPNGLSSVAVADVDGNYTVDYIYAGDLFGNLWKFDVSSTDPSKWTITEVNGVPTPLFTATYTDSNSVVHYQPITTAPVVGLNEGQSGYMIDFGTGQYLEKTDLLDTSVQTFYGVWDRNETPTAITHFTRSSLLQQQILGTNTELGSSTTFATTLARITSDKPLTWYQGAGLPATPSTDGYLGWYMDLVDQYTGTQAGERVIYNPILLNNRVVFVTNIPSVDPCLGGGTSWIMELNATTGSRLTEGTFDYNHDGAVDSSDLVTLNGTGTIGSGIQNTSGGKLSGLNVLYNPLTHNQVKLSSATVNGKVTINQQVEKQAFIGTGKRSWIDITPP